jgi:ATP-dependent helicase/DNAse subunit B
VRLDHQAWDALLGAVDELTDALRTMKTERCSAVEWLNELTALLSNVTVRVEANARHGVHLTIAGIGLPSADHVFAVGWREGLVPRRIREDPLLPDRVKRALNERGALLTPADERAAHEKERYERVRRAAVKTLTISWPATGAEGEQLLPSFYLHDFQVQRRTTRSVGDTTWPMPLAANRGERITRSVYLASHARVTAIGDELAAVEQALAALTTAEDRAYKGMLNARQRVELPDDIAAELASLAAASSASQAKMLAHCVYEHFAKRRLGLEVLETPTVDQRVLGTIAHEALRDLGRAGYSPDALNDVLEGAWRSHVSAELLATPAVQFEREMLLRNIASLVERETVRAAMLPSTPAYFELAFGIGDEGRDPASLDAGLTVTLAGARIPSATLRGSIDRVDIVERDGKRYGIATDYKSGKGESYFKDMEAFADFQLPIYCSALRLFDIEPVGAMYLGIASGERHGVIRADFADAFLIDDGCKGVKRLEAAVFDEYMQMRGDALRLELAQAARGELTIAPREDDCGYCDLRPVCRVGTFGVGGASGAD